MSDILDTDTNPEGVLGLMLRLRALGIINPDMLKAIETIKHDQFVPVSYFEKAWQNRSMPIECGQTLHAPDIVGRMVAALQLNKNVAVLEIGTGSGYQTGLLARLAKKVHTIDRYAVLLSAAKERLDGLDVQNVSFSQTDGSEQGNEKGLYDRIIVDSAYESAPRYLLDLLTSGGVVVTAIGMPREEQTVVRLTKIGSRFEREDLFKVRFGTLEANVAQAL